MEPLVFKGLTTSKDVVGREIKACELGERCLQTGSLKGVDRESEGTKVTKVSHPQKVPIK